MISSSSTEVILNSSKLRDLLLLPDPGRPPAMEPGDDACVAAQEPREARGRRGDRDRRIRDGVRDRPL